MERIEAETKHATDVLREAKHYGKTKGKGREAKGLYLVSLTIQLANMRVPITSSQGLQLCNSIIKDTKVQNVVVEYKKKMYQSV